MKTIIAVPGNDSRLIYGVLLLAVFLLSSGCSYVPDAMNPIEWYKGVAGWFSDEEEKEDTAAAKGDWQVPGADESYPNLATVPEGPSASERQEIAEGLAADTMHRRYVGEAEETAEAPSPPPQVTPPPPPAPPAAAPRTPVQGADIGAPAPPPLSGLPAVPPPPTPPRPGFPEVPPAAAAPPQPSDLPEIPPPPTPTPGTDTAEKPAGPGSLEAFDASKSVVSVRAGTILFANGSAGLSAADRRQLKKIAALRAERGGTLRVIGHASSRTADMDPLRHQLVNFNISTMRASNVASALIEYGVTPGKIFVGAVSDSEPIYLEVMPAGEIGNRRADIYLDY